MFQQQCSMQDHLVHFNQSSPTLHWQSRSQPYGNCTSESVFPQRIKHQFSKLSAEPDDDCTQIVENIAVYLLRLIDSSGRFESTRCLVVHQTMENDTRALEYHLEMLSSKICQAHYSHQESKIVTICPQQSFTLSRCSMQWPSEAFGLMQVTQMQRKEFVNFTRIHKSSTTSSLVSNSGRRSIVGLAL